MKLHFNLKSMETFTLLEKEDTPFFFSRLTNLPQFYRHEKHDKYHVIDSQRILILNHSK